MVRKSASPKKCEVGWPGEHDPCIVQQIGEITCPAPAPVITNLSDFRWKLTGGSCKSKFPANSNPMRPAARALNMFVYQLAK